jgi:putative ABC transport system substrate-binding protein
MEAGALMSYTFIWDELTRAPVGYIDRILKGASPADLPIQAPQRYELGSTSRPRSNLASSCRPPCWPAPTG